MDLRISFSFPLKIRKIKKGNADKDAIDESGSEKYNPMKKDSKHKKNAKIDAVFTPKETVNVCLPTDSSPSLFETSIIRAIEE